MRYAIGIDIGATKTKGIVANDRGKILIRREIETKAKRKRVAILDDIIEAVIFLKKYAEKKKLKLAGLGLGVPGIIKKGKLVFGGGTLSQFRRFNIVNYLRKKTGMKILADNDAKLFTLAESFFGAGKNYKRVAGIIWGTGIGSGFVDKKKNTARQMEIGHLIVAPNIKNEPKCGCGARGCVENLVSGKNIIRRYYWRGGKIKKADVKKIYHSKEKIAKEILEDAYKYLGMGITALIRATKPEIVIMGGGISLSSTPVVKILEKRVCRFLPEKTKMPKIVKSKIGEFSGALGATMLISKSSL